MAIAGQPPRPLHAPAHVAVHAPKPSRLVERFVIFEMICGLTLLSSSLQHFRTIFRTAGMGISLVLLFVLPGHGKLHPAAKAAFFALAIVALSILNPQINSFSSAAAQFGLYMAVLAPLFWVARVRMGVPEMRRVLFLQWGFAALSATVGVLQVYYPARFRFAVSEVVAANRGVLAMEQYRNAFGEMVYRPSGLTDSPGGAAGAGFVAVLFAAAFFLTDERPRMRAVYVGTMLVGMAAIYLSQVRVMLVMEMVCMLAFIAMLTLRAAKTGGVARGRVGSRRLMGLTGVMVLVAAAGFSWAVAVGGSAVADRITSLSAEDPTTVYAHNRGMFLTYTFETVLPEYPLGAGPGRWGMMAYYFGDRDNPRNGFLWSEIQWTAWLYDGGVPLMLVYVLAIALALRVAYKIALNGRFTELSTLAALVFADGVGMVAATFDSNLFASGAGLDFWMLNAMLFNVAYNTFSSTSREARPR